MGKMKFLYFFLIFVGVLSFADQSGAETLTNEKVFTQFSAGDWGETIKYDPSSDSIKSENCYWGMGWECHEFTIPKLADQDGITVYCDREHNMIFINDNGDWVWEDRDDRGGIPMFPESCDNDCIQSNDGSYRYAFKYTCPFEPQKKPRQLVLIDKEDKTYVINCAEQDFKVFLTNEKPILYDNTHEPLSVNKALCK